MSRTVQQIAEETQDLTRFQLCQRLAQAEEDRDEYSRSMMADERRANKAEAYAVSLRKFIEALPCPDPRCSDGSIISTGPDPQNDACEWCYMRHMLLNESQSGHEIVRPQNPNPAGPNNEGAVAITSAPSGPVGLGPDGCHAVGKFRVARCCPCSVTCEREQECSGLCPVHCHPEFTEAMKEYAQKLLHPENSQGLPQPECEKWAKEPKA